MANENKKANFYKLITFVNLSKIPGPRFFKYFLIVKKFQRNILQGFNETHQTYGDIASFPWPMNSVIIYSPKFYKQVLIDQSKKYGKGEQADEIRAIVGNGLGTNNDYKSWVRNRSIVSREFTKKSSHEYYEVINSIVDSHVKKYHAKIDICDQSKKLTLDIASNIFLGLKLDEAEISYFNEAVEFTSVVAYERIFQFFPIPYWVPLLKHIKFKKYFSFIDTTIRNAINTERQEQKSKLNILSRLVHAKDPETNESLTDLEVRDEIITILIAGYETTAFTLTWFFALMAKHQDIQDKLFSELKNYDGDNIVEDVEYFSQVVSEVMRLYPALPVLSRKALVDTQIGDFHIPKNTNVVLPIYVTQRSESYLKEPLSFNPDRFKDDEINKNHISNPFSKGPRRCVGETMALMEIAIIVKKVMCEYKIFLDGEFPKETVHVTLKPELPLWVRLEKR